MVNRVVLLFSGQGAQKVGMAKDWVESSGTARALAAKADEILGYSLTKIMFEGPEEELTRTVHCQPALYLHGFISLLLVREAVENFLPVASAGLSLGEFTAHAAAGTFSFEEGLRLVAKRGAFMEEACLATQGAMAALLGGEEEQIRQLASMCDVDIANLNAPGQVVVSGSVQGIENAISRAKKFGIRRAIKLNVAGAYHSRLMQGAQEKLANELEAVEISRPAVPVIANFTADCVEDEAEIRRTLAEQVTGSVRWTESVRRLIEMGSQTFLELGPGKVIAGLVAKIDPTVTVYSVEDVASLDATVAALL